MWAAEADRHLQVRPQRRSGAVIGAAVANAPTLLPESGRGPLIIQSIAAKQKPRRPRG
jgi:hypothetical protein